MKTTILRWLLGLAAVTALSLPATASEPVPFDPVGDWQGALSASGVELRLVFHIERDGDAYTTKIDSVDQGARGIPTGETTVSGAKLKVTVPAIGGTYEGELQDDGSVAGTWSQGPATLPLVLKLQTEAIQLHRPQEPKEPFPYRQEEVTFKNEAAEVTLAGTLTLPKGEGPFAAAVLISGSGPQDRDEALMGHRPFLVLADHLTRAGIAVLRYDDRGTAASTGDFEAATTLDFADDVRAAVAFLEARPDIAEIGLVGHSEGGLIAPLVAADTETVDFVVLLAGPAYPGKRIMLDQTERLFRGRGADAAHLTKLRSLQSNVFELALGDGSQDELKKAVGELIELQSGGAVSAEDTAPQVEAEIERLQGAWFRFFLGHDPVPVLAKVRQPLLALGGAKDFQVPSADNLGLIAETLKKAGHGDYETLELPNLNHLFQHAETGLVDEYAKIEETFAAVAMEKISAWILARTPAPVAAAAAK